MTQRRYPCISAVPSDPSAGGSDCISAEQDSGLPAEMGLLGALRRAGLGSDILSTAMFLRSGAFRLLMTALLAVVVPFCCCDFRTWLSASDSCHGPAEIGIFADISHLHGAAATLCHEGSGQTESAPSSNDQPADTQDCTCGKHDPKILPGVKPTLEFPPLVMTATLAWAPPERCEFAGRSSTCERLVWAFARPPTSLLRLHCALIV